MSCVSTHSPLLVRKRHQISYGGLEGIWAQHTTAQAPFGPAPPHLPRAFQLCAGVLHTRRAKPSPAAVHPYFCLPTTTPRCGRWFRPRSNHSSSSGQGASGSMRGHPGGKLSATAPCPCRTVPPETYPAGPTLTCQAATAAAASILGLSSCFLVESASTTPRAFSIGSKGLSPPSLLG